MKRSDTDKLIERYRLAQKFPYDLELPKHHDLIIGLFDQLPAPGEIFGEEQRQKWLRTAESIFEIIYKSDKLTDPSSPA